MLEHHRWSLDKDVSAARRCWAYRCDGCAFWAFMEPADSRSPSGWCGVPGLGQTLIMADGTEGVVDLIDAGAETVRVAGCMVPAANIRYEVGDGWDRWSEVVPLKAETPETPEERAWAATWAEVTAENATPDVRELFRYNAAAAVAARDAEVVVIDGTADPIGLDDDLRPPARGPGEPEVISRLDEGL